ncbi:MAG: hypothetical protein COV44_02525 [Deltaproteobacteria bacterium CG11_big_fil_rev_8_21_14_0_20_45_16]|nr:MAG: hypothetical protein COV44_02525 [Deltaproteobacteria bacterium CG11_big_fil_rev_8_21_14_0_20_45_16]
MTVLASLFSGISGIVSNGSALSVSGDNIANMNTMAFKSGNALFESNLTQKIGEVEVGLGSRLAATNTSFTQGAFGSSSRPTDLAIQGSGFFAVENAQNQRFYTRAGSFSQDAQGRLVTTVGGLRLLGYQITDGVASSTALPINLASINSTPEASTTISISMNLTPTSTEPANAFDGSSFTSAEGSSNFSVPGTLYDSLGTARDIITYFRKTSTPNRWEYYVLSNLDNLQDSAGVYDVDPAAGDDDTVILKGGTVTFDTDGTLLSKSETVAVTTINGWSVGGTASYIEAGELLNATSDIQWNGADALDFDEFQADFGDVSGSSAVATQYDNGSDSVATFVQSDGQGVGSLQSIDITEEGIIRGIFSNGDSRDLYSIPLATFANVEGLSRTGSNLFQATAQSGDPLLGGAGTTGRGEIRSFSIEQSNVDLATEFVKIIQFQRAFQASARTITAAADILQDLVNLGR